MVESVSTATTALISLVELLDKVKNMVISDVIQKEVIASLGQLQEVRSHVITLSSNVVTLKVRRIKALSLSPYSVSQCYRLAGDGELEAALTLSQRAMVSAGTRPLTLTHLLVPHSSPPPHTETAFFDPSILELLYFPDDQKYDFQPV